MFLLVIVGSPLSFIASSLHRRCFAVLLLPTTSAWTAQFVRPLVSIVTAPQPFVATKPQHVLYCTSTVILYNGRWPTATTLL